jgi:hypothetical protein
MKSITQKVQGRVMLKIRVVKAMLRVTAAAAVSLLVAFGAPAQTVRYVHTDGLGSVVLTTDKDQQTKGPEDVPASSMYFLRPVYSAGQGWRHRRGLLD